MRVPTGAESPIRKVIDDAVATHVALLSGVGYVSRPVFGQNMLFSTFRGSSGGWGEEESKESNKKGKHIGFPQTHGLQRKHCSNTVVQFRPSWLIFPQGY